MKFYEFKELKAVSSCVEIAQHLYGCTVKNGRCAAKWRGGKTETNVSIDKEEWHDHKMKIGGGYLELACMKFGGITPLNKQLAQEILGEFYHLTPKNITRKSIDHGTRYTELITQGYTETRRDVYHNSDGSPAFFEVRLDHPEPATHKKQYLLGHGDRWGLPDEIERVLFNLPAVRTSEWVCITEGPKKSCCLISRGVPATNCVTGSKKWRDCYSDALAGKDVVILPDNDDPGRAHADMVAMSLHGKAKSIRVVPTSPAPKGDVFDYLEKEGHTIDELFKLIADAPAWTPPTSGELFQDSEITPQMIIEAKQANSIPFRNYTEQEGKKMVRGKEVPDITKVPRTHDDLVQDIHRRFLQFPRRVGDAGLFDHDRGNGTIVELDRPHKLKAWISRKSKKNAEFTRGDAMASETELHESLTVMARRYESISLTPDWPKRDDVFYAYKSMPLPSPTLANLEAFLDFFLPATDQDRNLIRAFICAPLWFIPGISRPSWIVDSRDGQNSGKSKLAEFVSILYGEPAIATNKHELSQNYQQVVKRCVSPTGRSCRVFLMDNVEGDFSSPELSSLITSMYITGMAPYGHGEEKRPNNLTYVLTTNTATVSTDIADRSYYIHVRRENDQTKRMTWESRIQSHIAQHRLAIFADIILMVSRHKPFATPTRTRTSAFEASILQPACRTEPEYISTLEYMMSTRSESNVDEDQARTIIEVFNYELRNLGIEDNSPCFIRSEVVNSWAGRALRETHEFKGLPIQQVRNFSKRGSIPQIDSDFRRIQADGMRERHSGIAWNMTDATNAVTLIFKDADGTVKTKTLTLHELGYNGNSCANSEETPF